MIGMRMRFENPCDVQSICDRKRKHRIGCLGRRACRRGVVIKYWIDDRSDRTFAGVDNIRDRAGVDVKK